jgi:acetyltransferase-like isoleucine patch superfamily enzyme
MIATVSTCSDKADRIDITPPRRTTAQMRIKRGVQWLASLWVSWRWLAYRACHFAMGRRAFLGASESIARIPGLRGVYLRQAFYRRTLDGCGCDVYFGWQTVFSMPEAIIGERAYIGRFCSIGFADIGDEVMVADGVQILSGGREHATRANAQETMREQPQSYRRVRIGRGAWIGAGAVVMADIGHDAVIGAGAVVNRPIPAGCVAVGVPARVVKYPDNRAEE